MVKGMSDKQSAVSVDLDLTKPVTVLIEKIAGAAGVIYEPVRIKQKAKAQATAEITLAVARAEATAIEQRAIHRLMHEESRKQINIETIVEKAIPRVGMKSDPSNMDDGWVANFFEHSKIISDHEMQDVWARLLASEANSPGTYSKRTVNLLAELDKSDAELFTRLAGFAFMLLPDGQAYPFVDDTKNLMYKANGIDFAGLQHLETLGLIKFNSLAGFRTYRPDTKGGRYILRYHEDVVIAEIPDDKSSELNTGRVLFTRQGSELFTICSPAPVEGFKDYLAAAIGKNGASVQVARYVPSVVTPFV